MEIVLVPWSENTLTMTNPTSSVWDTGCDDPSTHEFSWSLSTEATDLGITASAYLHDVNLAYDDASSLVLSSPEQRFDLSALVPGNYVITVAASDRGIATKTYGVEITSLTEMSLTNIQTSPPNIEDGVYGCAIVTVTWDVSGSLLSYDPGYVLSVCAQN